MLEMMRLMVICGTVVVVAFLVLLAIPQSTLRAVLLEVIGWVGAAFALLYGVSPIDALPDFIPVVGWVDDVAVLGGGIFAAVTALRAGRERRELAAPKDDLPDDWEDDD
jgi:uncharacterized membrane protein YkvA (DUF1232 family)